MQDGNMTDPTPRAQGRLQAEPVPCWQGSMGNSLCILQTISSERRYKIPFCGVSGQGLGLGCLLSTILIHAPPSLHPTRPAWYIAQLETQLRHKLIDKTINRYKIREKKDGKALRRHL